MGDGGTHKETSHGDNRLVQGNECEKRHATKDQGEGSSREERKSQQSAKNDGRSRHYAGSLATYQITGHMTFG